MKVILTQSIPKLGKAGDVKEVAAGFFRNFLSPRGLAEPATPENLKRAGALRKKAEEQAQKELEAAQEIAKKLDGLELAFELRIDPKGEAYGSVNAEMLKDKLQEMGYAVEKHNIRIDESIRMPGEHLVKVELPHGLEAELRVIVEPV